MPCLFLCILVLFLCYLCSISLPSIGVDFSLPQVDGSTLATIVVVVVGVLILLTLFGALGEVVGLALSVVRLATLGVGRVSGSILRGGIKSIPTTVARSLSNPNTLRGATQGEIEALIPKGWIRSPTKGAGGTRWYNPKARGDQIRIMPGNPNDPNPIKRGPYVRVNTSKGPSGGIKSDPIPLQGNPSLK